MAEQIYNLDDADKALAENYRALHASTGEPWESIAARNSSSPKLAAWLRAQATEGRTDAPPVNRDAGGALVFAAAPEPVTVEAVPASKADGDATPAVVTEGADGVPVIEPVEPKPAPKRGARRA